MDFSFQQTVIIIAVVILIVTLVIIAYMMNSVEKMKPWPPSFNQCPDAWTYNDATKACVMNSNPLINVGSIVTDISCALNRTDGYVSCDKQGFTWGDVTKCVTGWVQGNSANARDPSSCYMLASVSDAYKPLNYCKLGEAGCMDSNGECLKGTKGTTGGNQDPSFCYTQEKKTQNSFSYTPSSTMQDNMDWAKAYGVSWDGLV
jgi:hypothetical protein